MAMDSFLWETCRRKAGIKLLLDGGDGGRLESTPIANFKDMCTATRSDVLIHQAKFLVK